MKKLLVSLSILTLLCIVLLPFDNAEARQGCCSHHGGVCGCHCCDGTSLSATCAPYYPQCSATNNEPLPLPPTPTPIPIPTPTPTPTPTPQPLIQQTETKQPETTQQPPVQQSEEPQTETEKESAEQNTGNNSIDSNKLLAELPKENNGGSIWWWVIGIGVVGYLFYTFRKRKE